MEWTEICITLPYTVWVLLGLAFIFNGLALILRLIRKTIKQQ